MNVYLQSVGCRVNQSEIEELACRFAGAGCTVVPTPDEADACVVNTCAVTAKAERKSRHRVTLLARTNPGARIAVIGCYASLSPQNCAALAGVAWVVPNSRKQRTVDIVASSPFLHPPYPLGGAERGTLWHRRTRAFVKVQDGCDNHCTYCVARLLRGSAQSRPLAEVVGQVQSLVARGFREVVLTGVSLGSYGRDLGVSSGLRMLVEALLAHTDVPRLRLSSVEPWDLSETLFQLWADSRLCRQLHLPLQAGCDRTLRRMGRPINTGEFARLVMAARTAVPDLAVTTDIIVGFPGEDEAAFRASLGFVAAMDFARLHVFPYSSRPGTAASRLPGQVPRDLLQTRARLVRRLGSEQASRFRQRFVGREMTVLWEQRRPDGSWSGLTGNYLRVIMEAERNLHGQITAARILAAKDRYLIGEMLE